jgi:hypothetical protein
MTNYSASYPVIGSGGGGGSGTVSSVGLLDGSSTPIYVISGSPVTTSGTLVFTLGTQSANKVFAGPTSGSAAQPTFRSLVSGDLPAGTGTVTSVAMTVPAFLSISGSPITTSGTLAVSYSGTALPILNGGTGQTTASAAFDALSPMTTAGDLIYGGVSGAGTRLGIGSTGNVLTVSGGNPVWSPPATSGTVTSVAMTVPAFLSISGSPITSSGTLAVSYSGTALPILNGGTGSTTATGTGSVVLANSPTLVTPALGTPTALVGTNITGTGTGFTSGVTQALASATTTVNVSSATAPTSGQILTATSGTAATWQTPSGGSGTVTSVAMTVPGFLSISGSPVTTSGTLAVSYSGTALPIANGGTAVTSVTTAPTATSFAGWDANKNLSANNFLYPLNDTSASSITLTVASNYMQYGDTGGNSAITVKLPVVTTLAIGQAFLAYNNFTSTSATGSSTVLTVTSSGNNTIDSLSPGGWGIYVYYANNGTGVNSWKRYGLVPGQIPGNQTNTAAAAGNVGELITATGTSVSVTSSGFTTVTSITVFSGDWDVSAMVYEPGSTGVTSISGGIATATNSNTGWTLGTTAGTTPITATIGSTITILPVQKLISSNGGTTYYLTAAATGATATITGIIRARRMR